MKTLKQEVRRGVRVFVPKMFNLLVIFGLVFQPVGPAGLASVAWAVDVAPDAADTVSTDTTKSDPEPAPAEEPEEESAAVEKNVPKVDTPPVIAPEKPTTSVVEEPVISTSVVTQTENGRSASSEQKTTDTEQNTAEGAESTGEEALVDNTENGAETSQEPEVVTPTPVDEPVDGTVVAPEGVESVPEASQDVPVADTQEEDLSG